MNDLKRLENQLQDKVDQFYAHPDDYTKREMIRADDELERYLQSQWAYEAESPHVGISPDLRAIVGLAAAVLLTIFFLFL